MAPGIAIDRTGKTAKATVGGSRGVLFHLDEEKMGSLVMSGEAILGGEVGVISRGKEKGHVIVEYHRVNSGNKNELIPGHIYRVDITRGRAPEAFRDYNSKLRRAG